MSWTGIYHLVLRLLPAALRSKHGLAMEALFAREQGQARARGRMQGALAGAAGVWDVVRRAAYEHVRHGLVSSERCTNAPQDAWNIGAHAPQPAGANFGGPTMRELPTRLHLRRHAASFAVAFVALTASLLALFASRQVPILRELGAPAGAIVEVVLLAVPSTAALTIPMAVLAAVLHEFTRLRSDGTLTAAQREHHGIRRLVVPVLVAAVGVAALALVVTAELVPCANVRMTAVLAKQQGFEAAAIRKSDREMTIGELRSAVRHGDLGSGEFARRRAAAYEVEFQKKFALSGACVIMTLFGVAVALRVPRSGAGLVIGASVAVYVAYYAMLVTGENLADRLVVSPFVGMWAANALLLTLALLAAWRRAPFGSGGHGAVVVSA
ncbi:MAG: LptF/LptG family permease [Gemmatimonadaceae bacterium]|nr:LptF/LptG family permease [Gemmatimonadaceae bacterium]